MSADDERGGYKDPRRLAGLVFLPLGFLARFPLAMFTVGVTMLVSWAKDSYADGGMASGALGLGSAIGAPLVGALADRFGQRIVVQLVGVLNVIAMVSLVALVKADSELGWILLLSFLIGFSAPQVGPLARARWIALVQAQRAGPGAERTLAAAMGWESMADELAFVFGPVAVSAIALGLGEYSPLLVAAGLTLFFVTWFAHHRTVDHVKRSTVPRELRTPPNSFPTLGCRCRSSECSAWGWSSGRCSRRSLHSLARTVPSRTPASSTTRWAWARRSPLSPRLHCRAGSGCRGGGLRELRSCWAGLFCSPLVHSVPGLLITMFVVGLGIGPALVSIFAVASYTSPSDRVAVVMTLMSSGIVAGTAVSGPVAGALADSAGYSQAFWVVAGAATLILISGIWTSKIVPRPE